MLQFPEIARKLHLHTEVNVFLIIVIYVRLTQASFFCQFCFWTWEESFHNMQEEAYCFPDEKLKFQVSNVLRLKQTKKSLSLRHIQACF